MNKIDLFHEEPTKNSDDYYYSYYTKAFGNTRQCIDTIGYRRPVTPRRLLRLQMAANLLPDLSASDSFIRVGDKYWPNPQLACNA